MRKTCRRADVARIETSLQDFDVARRLRRRAGAEREESARDWRHAGARVGVPARGVAREDGDEGWRGERKLARDRRVLGEYRRDDHGPQHVWRPSGTLGGEGSLERLVG